MAGDVVECAELTVLGRTEAVAAVVAMAELGTSEAIAGSHFNQCDPSSVS